MSARINNIKATIAYYRKQGKEAQLRRAEEIENGAPLNKHELAARRDEEIKAAEEKFGFDIEVGETRVKEPEIQTFASNAWTRGQL